MEAVASGGKNFRTFPINRRSSLSETQQTIVYTGFALVGQMTKCWGCGHKPNPLVDDFQFLCRASTKKTAENSVKMHGNASDRVIFLVSSWKKRQRVWHYMMKSMKQLEPYQDLSNIKYKAYFLQCCVIKHWSKLWLPLVSTGTIPLHVEFNIFLHFKTNGNLSQLSSRSRVCLFPRGMATWQTQSRHQGGKTTTKT